ncbi:hypothetical protein Mal4_53950 [Maioricimonas rarisocia]|uniref:Uncharacterized protein n=1 Tax=Maioricimonas rarisocia TaxID=2528026 RepID=A0A517ZEW4_9PLAN|nr:hypothetical protein [Maioricimonas rarisocia]QDU41030.1 hypothetical protein Mal4_53950 [Maioricimonas rarisocia]
MFARRILHHGPDPDAAPVLLSDRAVAGCWFELLRQGGCGAGSLLLHDGFADRHAIDVGDWISFEYSEGQRWYLGRVEERRATSPARLQLRLQGMSVELGQVFPGGFGTDADGVPPHRYAATDLFPNDPDRLHETADSVAAVDDLVTLLLQQYVTAQTHITHDPLLVETPPRHAPLVSLKLRGEESVRSVLKDLAVRAGGMSWGVDAAGKFFFLRPREDQLLVLREGHNLTSLHETRDSEFLFNRLLLTGDYVYDVIESSGQIARRSYRWRGNFFEPDSRAAHGDRRLRLWIPWIRTQQDALAFSREFFRTYAQPTSRYLLETTPQTELPVPWLGRIRLEDRHGSELTTARVQAIRVRFDHEPVFRLELGPDDPRELWPEPPHDERWERPEGAIPAGGDVSLTSSDGGGSSDGSSEGSSSTSAPASLSSASSISSDVSESSGESDASSDESESGPGTTSAADTSFSGSASSLSASGDSSLLSSEITSDVTSAANFSQSQISTSGGSDSGSATDSAATSSSLSGSLGSSSVDSLQSGSTSASGSDSGTLSGATTSNAGASSSGHVSSESTGGSDSTSHTTGSQSGASLSSSAESSSIEST